MNKYALIFCFLFWGYFAMAQTNDIMEFQSIRMHDTIKTKQTFKTINEVDKINDTFFFTTKYLKEEGLFLIEKRESYWIVYDYNDFASNYVVGKHHKLNNQYESIEINVSRSGYGINLYSWYLIFDLKNKTYLSLDKSSYNADEKNIVLNKCESMIKFKNNTFTVIRNCLPKNECGNCIESGIYKVKNGKFIKIKSSH